MIKKERISSRFGVHQASNYYGERMPHEKLEDIFEELLDSSYLINAFISNELINEFFISKKSLNSMRILGSYCIFYSDQPEHVNLSLRSY